MTVSAVAFRNEIDTRYLEFDEESNELGPIRGTTWHDIVSGPFPVLEATYAKKNSIFEIRGQN